MHGMAVHLFSYIAMKRIGWWKMQYLKKIKRAVLVESILLASLYSVFLAGTLKDGRVKEQPQAVEVGSVGEREYIKWVDFNVSYEALCEAYQWDVDTYEAALEDKESVHVDWIELLAYVGARHGGGISFRHKSRNRQNCQKITNQRDNHDRIGKRHEILFLLPGSL